MLSSGSLGLTPHMPLILASQGPPPSPAPLLLPLGQECGDRLGRVRETGDLVFTPCSLCGFVQRLPNIRAVLVALVPEL